MNRKNYNKNYYEFVIKPIRIKEKDIKKELENDCKKFNVKIDMKKIYIEI